MAFEALDSQTLQLFDINNLSYKVGDQAINPRTGEPLIDAAGDIKLQVEWDNRALTEFERIKHRLTCEVCNAKVHVRLPSICKGYDENHNLIVGYKRPPYFWFNHSVGCPEARERGEDSLSSFSPPIKHLTARRSYIIGNRDRLMTFFTVLWSKLINNQAFNFRELIRSWEIKNREVNKSEVLIRNKDVLMPFLAFYQETLLALYEASEDDHLMRDRLVMADDFLIDNMPSPPGLLNHDHPICYKHSFLKGLTNKFPYTRKNATQEKDNKMITELLNLKNEPDKFFKRKSGSKYRPLEITTFKDLNRIFYQNKEVTKLIKEFLVQEPTLKESVEKMLSGVVEKEDNEPHVKPCFEMVMLCEELNVDCCEVLSIYFDWLSSSKGAKFSIDDKHHNHGVNRTTTLSKINTEVRYSLFYERCYDVNLYVDSLHESKNKLINKKNSSQ